MAQQPPTAQGFVFRNSIVDAQRNASMPSILYGQTTNMPSSDHAPFHAVAAPPPPPSPHSRSASPRGILLSRPQHDFSASPSQPQTPNLSIFPQDLNLHEPKHSSSRSISPIGNLAPVPPAFTELHDVSAARRATISRPSTPRGISTRASFSQSSPRGTLERGIVMNEKPRNSRSRLREHSPGGMSFTSTVRPNNNRKTYLINGQTTFAQRVFDAGKRDLLYDLKQSSRVPWRFKDDKQGTLDLSTLLRMQQHVLQQKIVEQVRAIGERGAWMEIGVGESLKEYCQTARDLEYMQSASSLLPPGTPDPFLLSTSDPLQSLLLEEGQLVAKRPHPELDNPLLTPRLPTLKRTPSARRRLRRILGIILAALAVLTPYLLATFVRGGLARVVVGCACIVLFAGGAVVSRMSGVVAGLATLGYAAAVVVFMGVKPGYYFGGS